jgi:hypothetical protein
MIIPFVLTFSLLTGWLSPRSQPAPQTCGVWVPDGGGLSSWRSCPDRPVVRSRR